MAEPDKKICAVMAAYNEELVIGSSLDILKKFFPNHDIYVVSDGSTDKTAEIVSKNKVNFLNKVNNIGKTKALHTLIKNFKLTEKYDYILFTDADTHLHPTFLNHVRKHVNNNVACIVGTVLPRRRGLVSAYRVFDYSVSHRIFKNAQNHISVVMVAPGCASLFRIDIIKKLHFSSRTLTEDFDLTIQIHLRNLGEVLYEPKALVITQDPINLKDYFRQVLRWYTGFWQNIKVHRLYRPYNKVSTEAYIMVGDSFLWVAMLFLGFQNPALFLVIFIRIYELTILLAAITIIIEKQYWALAYVPIFPIFYFINMSAYFLAFTRIIFISRQKYAWDKPKRYAA